MILHGLAWDVLLDGLVGVIVVISIGLGVARPAQVAGGHGFDVSWPKSLPSYCLCGEPKLVCLVGST